MQSNTHELAQVAATAQAIEAGTGRVNLYAGIHKALRAFMADTLLVVGRTDPADAQEVAATRERLGTLLDLCAAHVRHEDGFVHPAIEARSPGVVEGVADEHAGHLEQIARLRSMANGLDGLAPAACALALQNLYLALALFVAENLQHMHTEETVHNTALWQAFSDAELVGIHDGLLATVPPAEMMLVMRWMLPQMNAPERLELLGGMRQGAPAPVFQAVLDGVRAQLAERDWAKLARGLGLAPVDGLVMA